MSKGLPRLLEEGRVEVRLDNGGTRVLTLASIGALMDHLAKAAKLLGYDCQAAAESRGIAKGRIEAIAALGHVRVPNGRCTARYREVENPAPGPKGRPVWCDLKAGHEGPHRHISGHHSHIMDRDHLIEMKPLPDLCQKCGTGWPCKDATAILSAAAPQETAGEGCVWCCGNPSHQIGFKHCPYCSKPTTETYQAACAAADGEKGK